MNPPYPPPPGYPQQPGYPPPQRQGMGCFARGCITIVVIVMLLGVLFGGTALYLYNNAKTFVSPTPVSVRSFQANDAQYQDVMRRYTEFLQALNAGRAATLTLTASDLNTLIARDPEFKDVRGRLFVDIKDSELIAEASIPVDNKGSARRTSAAQKAYFNGRVFFSASYSDGEATMHVRRVESLDGKPLSDFLLRFFNQIDLGQFFNQEMHDQQRNGTAWAEAMEKVDKIVVDNGQIVVTATESQPATNPVPLPGESPKPVASPSDEE